MNRRTLGWTFAFGVAASVSPLAQQAMAGEADDLQTMIDRSRRNATDLQKLDEQRLAAEEIAVMNTWLDEAWRLRSEKKYDKVREVLDRCDAQADMIREHITAGQLMEQARQEEAGLAATKKRIEELRVAIDEAKQKKAGLEAMAK